MQGGHEKPVIHLLVAYFLCQLEHDIARSGVVVYFYLRSTGYTNKNTEEQDLLFQTNRRHRHV